MYRGIFAFICAAKCLKLCHNPTNKLTNPYFIFFISHFLTHFCVTRVVRYCPGQRSAAPKDA
nr:MAG TPA: hypothetical protein [Caudoviricetes sp.]